MSPLQPRCDLSLALLSPPSTRPSHFSDTKASLSVNGATSVSIGSGAVFIRYRDFFSPVAFIDPLAEMECFWSVYPNTWFHRDCWLYVWVYFLWWAEDDRSLSVFLTDASKSHLGMGKCGCVCWKQLHHLCFLPQTPVEEVPAAIAPFQGRVLIGVGKLLRVYDLGKKKLLRKCENKVTALVEGSDPAFEEGGPGGVVDSSCWNRVFIRTVFCLPGLTVRLLRSGSVGRFLDFFTSRARFLSCLCL